jgi:hypothetical protein
MLLLYIDLFNSIQALKALHLGNPVVIAQMSTTVVCNWLKQSNFLVMAEKLPAIVEISKKK